jgi:predicted AAA+ superfamily ATPase
VKQYIDTKDFILIRNTQNVILQGYLDDMSKYNVYNEIKKTRQTYSSVTVQLSKKNTRFQYKLVKKGGRASEFENAIEWLSLAGIVTQIFKIEQARLPLENYKDIDAFKIYISDVGLLCAKKDVVPESILYESDVLDDFKGGMTENYVLSQLKSNGYTCYYWTSGNRAEIDFVVQKEGNVVPIEVKSTDNPQAKSLKVYMNSYGPKYAIKLSTKNFGFENNIKSIPLYAAFCI